MLTLIQFLSTLSLRRATIVGGAGNNAISISIHALLAESDANLQRNQHQRKRFLSTLSLRRATGLIFFLCVVSLFLSTLSLRRATF